MAKFIVRAHHPAAALACAALGCAAAGPLLEGDVRLTAGEWSEIRSVLAWPGQPIRGVHVRQVGDEGARLLEVEIDSVDVDRAEDFRLWFRALCSNGTGAWKCEPVAHVVQPAAGGAIAIGPEVTPQDVLVLARYMGHVPGRPGQRELLSVHASGGMYQVSYRFRGCEHLVKLRREGDLFMLAHPRAPGVSACP
ncbi:hypothetical protein GCM10028796_59190 [Ramlibacter monticola]|uniref:Lipoprotein n=1 Tax=Ramlibacter monticola TaxID=1926872 RepID=A0A936Z3X8_9BURK|nr:hypothetical protein [Ramlibacter monticola]MBL0393942.1 hypothetical protein [Ramlibacter monticola]